MECANCRAISVATECESYFGADLCRACRLAPMHPNGIALREDSLWIKSPTIAKRWSTKNRILPEDIGPKSQKGFIFHCSSCPCELTASPGNLSRSGNVSCWNCSRKAAGAKNSLPRGKTVSDSPELISRWDFLRNEVDPATVSYRSNRRFYWLCEQGHSTIAPVYNRESNRRGCSVCMERFHVSRGERELASFIEQSYSGKLELNCRSLIYPYEIDVFLPELGIAFEFNGDFYHSESFIRRKSAGAIGAREQHERKRALVGEAGGVLAIVWECDWHGPNRSRIETAIISLLEGRSLDPILDKMILEN